MGKEAVILFMFIVILSVFANSQDLSKEIQDPGLVPGDAFYFADKVGDDLRLSFSSEENKALVAAEIHDERIAEARALVENNEFKSRHLEEAISEAEEKIKIVQEDITPELNEEIQESTKNSIDILNEVKEKVPEQALSGIENAIDKQIVEEKKTQIVSEISSKIDKLCLELIELVGLEEAMKQELRCNPNYKNSPKWLERKVDDQYKKFDENSKKKFFEEMTVCFNDPRECRCSEIPVKSFSNTCFKIIPYAIKCEFEDNDEACGKIDEISKENENLFDEELPKEFERELEEFFRKKESEGFDKHAPPECREAGLKTRQECMKLMMKKYMPQECKDAGATTRQACEKIMMEKYGGKEGFRGPPPECTKDGRFIGPKECEQIMLDKYLPRECKEAKAFTRESCEAIMISKHAPSECIYEDGRFIGREKCEEIIQLKHKITNGINQRSFNPEQAMESCLKGDKSRQECEEIIKNKFAQEFPEPTYKAREVISNLDNNPQVQHVISNFDRIQSNVQNIPQECVGLTREECGQKTGQTFTPEVPHGIILRDGEAIPITTNEFQEIISSSESNVEEININEVREEINTDVDTLQSSVETLEETPHDEVASAIESFNEPSQEASSTEPAQENPPEISGSVVLDVLKLMQELKK